MQSVIVLLFKRFIFRQCWLLSTQASQLLERGNQKIAVARHLTGVLGLGKVEGGWWWGLECGGCSRARWGLGVVPFGGLVNYWVVQVELLLFWGSLKLLKVFVVGIWKTNKQNPDIFVFGIQMAMSLAKANAILNLLRYSNAIQNLVFWRSRFWMTIQNPTFWGWD